MLLMLKHILETPFRTAMKSDHSQEIFERYCTSAIHCLLLARLFVLSNFKLKVNASCLGWYLYRKDHKVQCLFRDIYRSLLNMSLPFQTLDACVGLYDNVYFIFDESQILLEYLKTDFHSLKDKSISNYSFVKPRSFFSFLANFMISSGFKSI